MDKNDIFEVIVEEVNRVTQIVLAHWDTMLSADGGTSLHSWLKNQNSISLSEAGNEFPMFIGLLNDNIKLNIETSHGWNVEKMVLSSLLNLAHGYMANGHVKH